MRSVSFSDGGLRDRDIIFRDERELVFVSLAAQLRFRHAKLTGEGRVRILATECVSFSLLFFVSPSYRFRFFFLPSNAHTHINKEGAETHRKAERRHYR